MTASARVCPTNLTVPEIHANAAVLEELKSSLLTERVLEAAVERAVAILCQPDDDGRGLRQELVRVEGSTLMVLTPRGLPAAGDDVDPLGSVWIRLILSEPGRSAKLRRLRSRRK